MFDFDEATGKGRGFISVGDKNKNNPLLQ